MVSPVVLSGCLYGFVFLSAVDYVLLLDPVVFDFLAHSFLKCVPNRLIFRTNSRIP